MFLMRVRAINAHPTFSASFISINKCFMEASAPWQLGLATISVWVMAVIAGSPIVSILMIPFVFPFLSSLPASFMSFLTKVGRRKIASTVDLSFWATQSPPETRLPITCLEGIIPDAAVERRCLGDLSIKHVNVVIVPVFNTGLHPSTQHRDSVLSTGFGHRKKWTAAWP